MLFNRSILRPCRVPAPKSVSVFVSLVHTSAPKSVSSRATKVFFVSWSQWKKCIRIVRPNCMFPTKCLLSRAPKSVYYLARPKCSSFHGHSGRSVSYRTSKLLFPPRRVSTVHACWPKCLLSHALKDKCIMSCAQSISCRASEVFFATCVQSAYYVVRVSEVFFVSSPQSILYRAPERSIFYIVRPKCSSFFVTSRRIVWSRGPS